MKTKMEVAQEMVELQKKGTALFTEILRVEKVAQEQEKLPALRLAFLEVMLETDNLTNEYRHIKAREEMGIK